MTFPVAAEDGALSEAMTAVIGVLHRTEGRDAVKGACQIRAALEPKNGYGVSAEVPRGPVRAAIARGMRAVAGDHPLGAKLTAMADELDPPPPAPEPPAEPVPAPRPRPAPPLPPQRT